VKAHLRLGFTSASKAQMFSAAPAFELRFEIRAYRPIQKQTISSVWMTSSKWYYYDWLYACAVR